MWRSDANRRADRVYKERKLIEYKIKIKELYGDRCVCCGLTSEHNLTVDHIQPVQGKRLNRLSFLKEVITNPDSNKYQILCFGCNISKGRKNKYCKINHILSDNK